MKSTNKHMELISSYLMDKASQDEVDQLELLMLNDPQLRADFLAYARMDANLSRVICKKQHVALFDRRPVIRRCSILLPVVATLVCGVFLTSLIFWAKDVPANQLVVGRFGESGL